MNRLSKVILPKHTLHHPSLVAQLSTALSKESVPVVNNYEWNFHKADYRKLYNNLLATHLFFIHMLRGALRS